MAADRISHSSELGSWEMVRGEPAPALRPALLRYYGYDERTVAFSRRRELATPHAVLIVGFGRPIEVAFAGSDTRTRAAAFASGPSDRPAFVDSFGAQRGVQIDLTPLGAFTLIGVPMRELANRVVDLEDLLGADGRRLPERLDDAPSWKDRFAILDEVLGARLERGTPVAPDVTWAWRRLRETGGKLGVAALAAELGCSRRHLGARFSEQVGLPPKTVARLMRFERAARVLSSSGPKGLAEVALHCGYYDQAHLNRDFREFAGLTPTRLESQLLPDGGGIADDCLWPEVTPEFPSVQATVPVTA